MKTFVMKNLILIIALSVSQLTNVKPRIIDIDKELKTANSIEYCRIINYDDSIISYELTYLKTSSESITSMPTLLRTARLTGYDKNLIGLYSSGSLPKLGQNCYIVIDSIGIVSLLGIAKDNFIYFWSPINTGSECIIKHSTLFSCAEKGNEIDNDTNTFRCWTSVKISISDFIDNISHNAIECGSIMVQDGKTIFIPDFAHSSAYTISDQTIGLKDGQKLCIEWKKLKYNAEIIRQIE
jgi:hypothetical protein